MAEPPRMLISGGTLIDGTGSRPVGDAGVLVSGNRIVAVGRAAALRDHPEAAGAEIVDAAGCWIIPGLIDAHIHACFTGAEAMPLFLAAGVTTIRDVGGRLDELIAIKERMETGLPGPRLIYCGPLIDGEPASLPPAIMPILQPTSSPADAAALAEECLSKGARGIKVYFRLPSESVRQVIRTVGGRVPVTGHLGRTSATEAAREGIECLEHVIVSVYNDVAPEHWRFNAMEEWLNNPAFWSGLLAGWAEADLSGPRPQRLLELMCEREVTLDATLDVMSTTLGQRDYEPVDPNLRYLRPELVRTWEEWRTRVPDRFGSEAWADAKTTAQGHARCAEFVRRLHEMGGRVIAGTDVGAVPFMVPGFSLHQEVEMLAEAGLSPTAAVKAATLDAAAAIGIQEETGSIEAGKAADIVILDADPLRKIANTKNVRHVIAAGTLFHPDELLSDLAAPK